MKKIYKAAVLIKLLIIILSLSSYGVYAQCIPATNGNIENFYITRVQLQGTTSVDNSSTFSISPPGYENFSSQSVTISRGSTLNYTFTIGTRIGQENRANRIRLTIFVDWNDDLDFDDPGERIIRLTNDNISPFSTSYSIPQNAPLGNHLLRIRARDNGNINGACNNMWNTETEDYTINVTRVPNNVFVLGNGSIIPDGSTAATVGNNSSFGPTEINEVLTSTRTYTILNDGANTVNLTGSPNIVSISGDPEFTIVNQPTLTTLNAGQSTTFEIAYDPDNLNVHTANITIPNSDPLKNPYNFAIAGQGAQIYPDTDGDGVPDNIDVDDDNDGLLDIDEQNICSTSPLATTADVVFLNETFGAGLNRARINTVNTGVTTTYCFEDGTTAQAADECDNGTSLGDGKYTVHWSVTDGDNNIDISPTGPDMSTWSTYAWYGPEDHTPGDTNGRMAIFNASVDPGIFYETEIVGTVPGAPIDYSFYVLNIDELDSAFSPGELPRGLPNITVNFLSLDKTITYTTYVPGDIPRCESVTDNSCPDSEWIFRNTTVTLPVSNFIIQLVNNAPGGAGNDLAMDDIRISQTLCDLDGDGVADVIDLDNDNDGIPNIYEIGIPTSITSGFDSNQDATIFNDTSWVDTDENGMDDRYEPSNGFTALDTDNDGVPDYLDLDSDNDGIFDALENDGRGDIDINGNGVGVGNDASTGVVTDIYDGDGLLAIIDSNDDDSDEDDHGTTGFIDPLDSDSDGIPDFRDLYSNDATNSDSSQYDILNSFYASTDANNDGRVDATTDADKDGVYDTINDFDISIYGAPIDLDRDLCIDLDGRNDHMILESTVNPSLSNLTYMMWLMIDPSSSGGSTIVADNRMEINLLSNDKIQVILKDATNSLFTLETSDALVRNKWYNISVIYDSNNNRCKIFRNGVRDGIVANNGIALNNSGSYQLTIGNKSNLEESNYFNGSVDEIRIFSKALNHKSLRRMMYQEIEEQSSDINGKALPRIINNVNWSDLILYYSFAQIEDDQLIDVSNSGNNATLYNIKSILPQSAPIPYITAQDGDLNTPATFKIQDWWDPQDLTDYPYSILHIKNNVTQGENIESIGLIIDTGASLTISDGYYVGNDWQLFLDGTLDLLGDAQLLQYGDSELNPASAGTLKRRQEGESNPYSYNYWSSPVGQRNGTTNNNNYYLNMLEDEYGQVSFTGINTRTPPITQPATISGRWLHTMLNGRVYTDWLRMNPSTSALIAGQGWTQKGTGNPSGSQEYIFNGKPNNGEINISATNNDLLPILNPTTSLVGNPYPSAIDARKFITDNLALTDGTVYMWDQFRGTDHFLANYEGGYATVTLLATLKAAQFPGLGLLGGNAAPALLPTFHIPVSQGFFVNVIGNGSINFNNEQRVFKKENLGESLFLAAPGATPVTQDRSNYQDINKGIIRLEMTVDNGASREMVIGFDPAFTDQFNRGYDAKLYSNPNENDLFVTADNENYIIKTFAPITPAKIIDLTINGLTGNIYKINATEIQNVPASQELWLLDNETNTYHDLRSGDYIFTLSQDGLNSSRFDIVFSNTTLSVDTASVENAAVYYNNSSELLRIDNYNGDPLKAVVLYSLSGKEVFRFRESELNNIDNGLNMPRLSSGLYLVNLITQDSQFTHKISIN